MVELQRSQEKKPICQKQLGYIFGKYVAKEVNINFIRNRQASRVAVLTQKTSRTMFRIALGTIFREK